MSQEDREKWEARYREAPAVWPEESHLLRETLPELPRTGRALDLACGLGRNGLALAAHGLCVTLADISPRALALARGRGAERGLAFESLEIDLDVDSFPRGPWDVVMSCCFLWRPLFAACREHLAPGGWLVYVQPTRRNLERHPRPPADYLLDEGEALRLARGLRIVRHEEGWLSEGRHEVWLVARRDGSG